MYIQAIVHEMIPMGTDNEKYLNSEGAKPISVSMPLTGDACATTIAKPYFSGLVPDETARSRLANALGISDTNAFGMLEIIGGECAGALSLLLLNADVPTSSPADATRDNIDADIAAAEERRKAEGHPSRSHTSEFQPR